LTAQQATTSTPSTAVVEFAGTTRAGKPTALTGLRDAGGEPDEDLTGTVDHPRRHVDQPAPDELDVVGLGALGCGVTEVFLIDRIGAPFAQPAPVAGGDLGGEHRDQVMGDHDGGLPGSVGGGLAHREVDRSAAVLGLLDPLLYMRALAVPALDLGGVASLSAST